jgi:hypothetical protein
MTQAPEAPARTRAQIADRTLRTDPWWKTPRITATLLTIWVAYATVRVLTGHWYFVPQYHYLTPFYSPCVSGECTPDASSLGHWIPAVPPIIPYAFVSLPFVLGFRLSCYYYRRAYYRAFWRSPAACAVREPHASYSGETKFPLIFQNIHRYFWLVVLLISVLNTWDAAQAFRVVRVRARVDHHARECGPAVDVHARLPFLQAHHRRAPEAFFPASGAILDMDEGVMAECPAHAVCLDNSGIADDHRPVHHAGGQRGHLRPSIL